MNIKKNKKMLLTRILYGTFMIATIITFFIVYKNIDNDISFKFLLGYVCFSFFMVIYIPVITLINTRNVKGRQITKGIVKFISLLILFTALTYAIDYIIRPFEISLVTIFSTSVGLSFSITFFHTIFLKEKI